MEYLLSGLKSFGEVEKFGLLAKSDRGHVCSSRAPSVSGGLTLTSLAHCEDDDVGDGTSDVILAGAGSADGGWKAEVVFEPIIVIFMTSFVVLLCDWSIVSSSSSSDSSSLSISTSLLVFSLELSLTLSTPFCF